MTPAVIRVNREKGNSLESVDINETLEQLVMELAVNIVLHELRVGHVFVEG